MSKTGSTNNGNATGADDGYPSGHLGYLSPDQESLLQEFKRQCHEKGCYQPASESIVASHDDATLLRFLRARCFDVPSAIEQFTVDVNWRKTNNLDTMYETMDVKYYEETRFLYPQWTGRCDRLGVPVFMYEVKQLSSQAMAAYDDSSKKSQSKVTIEGKFAPKFSRLFALYEDMVKFVMPLCSMVSDRKYPKAPITRCCNLVDVSGVGLKQFWDLRGHMLDASALATAHYPETLDRIIIIGTPAFFPMVWGWIQKWFDANTTSKILILGGSDMLQRLSSIIEPQNIPKKYGGELEFEFGNPPELDPEIKGMVRWEDGWSDFPLNPMIWIDKGDSMEAYSVGSFSGSQQKQKVCTVMKTHTTPASGDGERCENNHNELEKTKSL